MQTMLFALSLHEPLFISALLGAGLASAATCAFLLMKRGASAVPTAQTEPTTAPHESKAFAEHRHAARRAGTWIKLFLRRPDSTAIHEAHVVDYTSDGVGILLFSELAPGSTIEARAARAPDSVAWSVLEVRSCQQLEGNVWRAGCRVSDPAFAASLRSGL